MFCHKTPIWYFRHNTTQVPHFLDYIPFSCKFTINSFVFVEHCLHFRNIAPFDLPPWYFLKRYIYLYIDFFFKKNIHIFALSPQNEIWHLSKIKNVNIDFFPLPSLLLLPVIFYLWPKFNVHLFFFFCYTSV